MLWLVIGVGLLLAWVLGFVVFEVASFAIHLLVIAAVVSAAVYLYQHFRGRHGGVHAT